MNEHKISFIICWNDEFYMRECQMYLEELVIPDGYEVDLIEVTEAKSMTAGYNEGMRRSDAKYKIYMHQDVFLTNKNFLLDLLDIFHQDVSIGLVGMVGTPYMIKTGTMWDGVRYGGFYRLQEMMEKEDVRLFFPITEGYMEMEAVDGLLLATQYDIPWREDLFTKWDFYDVSQSFEFRKAGYKVVVPGQNPEWYIHDCGMINLENYFDERKLLLREYSKFMQGRSELKWEQYLDKVMISVEKAFHGKEKEKKRLLTYIDDLKTSYEKQEEEKREQLRTYTFSSQKENEAEEKDETGI